MRLMRPILTVMLRGWRELAALVIVAFGIVAFTEWQFAGPAAAQRKTELADVLGQLPAPDQAELLSASEDSKSGQALASRHFRLPLSSPASISDFYSGVLISRGWSRAREARLRGVVVVCFQRGDYSAELDFPEPYADTYSVAMMWGLSCP